MSYWGSYFKSSSIREAARVCFRAWVVVPPQGAAAFARLRAWALVLLQGAAALRAWGLELVRLQGAAVVCA